MSWKILRDAASGWMAHKASTLGAAIAYYSLFSIGPLIVIVIAIAGLAFGDEAVRGQVSLQLSSLLGEQGAKGVEGMLAAAGKPAEGLFATALSVATLIFAAIGVVVQLKDALNSVWEVKSTADSGIWRFVRTYPHLPRRRTVPWFFAACIAPSDHSPICNRADARRLNARAIASNSDLHRVVHNNIVHVRDDVQMAPRC